MDEYGYDDIFDEPNELFVTEDDEKSFGSDSEGDYLTEQAHYNDLESSISIMERSSKFLFNIYVELLRIIRPLELSGSYKRRDRQTLDIRLAENENLISSPRHSLHEEDELEEDELLSESQDRQRSIAGKKKTKTQVADMRHILGFLN